MNIQAALAQQVAAHSLADSPFYQAWSMGTLSSAALQTYASEYGNFLNLLPIGWQTLGDAETAHEETEHAEMWADFAQSLAAKIGPVHLTTTQKLIEKAKLLFAEPASAMGAMYAFEVQQPGTASSKLRGLQTHYTNLHADEAYFEVHSHNEHESEKLLKMMEALSPADQQTAIQACAQMSQLLWDALDGIYTHLEA
jgi:pyrroloquinoline-quinone synthase